MTQRRRTLVAAAAVVAVGALGGCGGAEKTGAPRGCLGTADGGTVVVQSSSASLGNGLHAGVGSIDVDPDRATAILTLSEGDDPSKVRSLNVSVGTEFAAVGQEYTVVQICRGSLTLDPAS